MTGIVEKIRKWNGYKFPRLGSAAFRGFFKIMPEQITTELFPDIIVNLNTRDSTQRATYWQGERFEFPTAQVLASWGKECTVFFDIGSNYGFFSYWMLTQNPRIQVHAFEPNPKTFEFVQNVKRQNSLNRFHAWNLGLGDVEARLELHPGLEDSGHSTFGAHPGLKQQPLSGVDVLPFNRWLERTQLTLPSEPVWVAKIDVEGFELKVLKGMEGALKAKAFRGISLEINPFTLKFCDTSADELLQFLRSCGYVSLAETKQRDIWPLQKTENDFFVPEGLLG